MRLERLRAVPDPAGHLIEITWQAADPVLAPGARVVRRAEAFPVTPDPATASAGVVVADTAGSAPVPVEQLAGGLLRVRDGGLAEGTHYYQVYPYAGAAPDYDDDPANRVAAAAGAPYGLAAWLAEHLPAVYHRFDIATPAAADDPLVAALTSPEHHDQGQLRRFLELPGAELDRLYGDIGSLLQLADPRQVDGRFLPLLASWIGWRTDYRLGYDQQRAQVVQAPALYRATGTVPGAVAAAHRITGWPVQVKEYVDNVAVTNHPERRNLWLAQRTGAGDWEVGEAPLSIDSSPHGRPAVVAGPATDLTLIYHAAVDGSHEIRWKQRSNDEWQPSEPVVATQVPGREEVRTEPAAARQGDVTWVFWSVQDRSSGTWRIDLRRRGPAGWSAITTFRDGATDTAERRSPAATVDPQGALWLFWLEGTGGQRRLRHARFTQDPWVPVPSAGADVPGPAGQPLRPESPVSVVSRPPQGGDPVPQFRRVVVLWARRVAVPGQPGQTRWRVVARAKDGLDPADPTDWTSIERLTGADELRQDLEPTGIAAPDGSIHVVLASTRAGGWGVFRTRLTVAPLAFGTPAAITDPPFSHRHPVPLTLGADGDPDLVCVRSNRSLQHPSDALPRGWSNDRRWSGSTTVRVTDAAAIALRGTYEDHTTYTVDAGRSDEDHYARDTVGLFPDTTDTPEVVSAGRARLRAALPDFIPVTCRAVLIAE